MFVKKPPRRSLRYGLFALILFAVLPAFGLIIYNAIDNLRRADDDVKDAASRIVRLAARNHEQLIDEAYSLVTLMTRLPRPLLNAPGCQALLYDLWTPHPSFANIAVISLAGEVTCSARPEYTGVNYGDRPWFKDAISQQKFVTSEYLLGRVTTNPSVIFAAPLLDRAGTVQSVLGVSVRLEWIDRLSEQAELPIGSTYTLVDWQGTVLARYPRARGVGKSPPETSLVRAMLSQTQETMIERADADGVDRLYVVKPLGEHSGARMWYLAIGIPKATAYAQTRAILLQNLIFMGIVAALALAVAWWGSTRLILRPIRSLVDSSTRLGKGDLSARIAMNDRHDEIGQLAGAFDQMAEALELREVERKKAEEIHAQLAAIVESSNDAIIGRTLDGIVTSWNKAAERLFGYAAEEMLGKSIMLLMPQDQVESVTLNFARIARGEHIDSYETIRLKKGGELVDVSVTASPVSDNNGAVTGASSITRDISQRQRSEAEIKALHDISQEITSTLDLQRVLQILLEKIKLLLPYAAAQIRLINKETGQLERVACPREERWKLGEDRLQHAIIDTVLTTKRSLTVGDLQADEQNARREFYRQHGWVSYLGVPLIVKDEAIGVLSLFTGSLREFTKREILFAETLAKQASIAISNSRLYEETKRLSDELTVSETESRRLANGLIQARDDEAKRIAHTLHDESGQLLALVYIALDELSADLADDADKNQIQEIKHLLDSVEERWRDLSHELHPSMLDHLGLTATTEYLTSQIAKRTGLQINLSDYLNERLPATLELTLFRVVQEALNNIIRHAHARTVAIRITQQEDWIQCAIQDDGIGFDPAATARRYKLNGAGLGLVGMRERIEAISGSLEILSTPGEGTKLFISVRREKDRESSRTACR